MPKTTAPTPISDAVMAQLEDLPKSELLDLATDQGLTVSPRSTKTNLIAAIRKAQPVTPKQAAPAKESARAKQQRLAGEARKADPTRGITDAMTPPAADDSAALDETVAALAAAKLAEAEAAQAAAVEAEATAAATLEAMVTAATDRLERLALAKAEHVALGEWARAGSPDPRPATPNLDAIQAESTYRTSTGAKATPRKASTPRVTDYERYNLARTRPNGKRGGTKVSQADLEKWIAAEHAAHPTATRFQVLEVCCLVEGWSVGDARFNASWDAVLNGTTLVKAEAPAAEVTDAA